MPSSLCKGENLCCVPFNSGPKLTRWSSRWAAWLERDKFSHLSGTHLPRIQFIPMEMRRDDDTTPFAFMPPLKCCSHKCFHTCAGIREHLNAYVYPQTEQWAWGTFSYKHSLSAVNANERHLVAFFAYTFAVCDLRNAERILNNLTVDDMISHIFE